jgi:hypothetical protein
MLIILEKAFDKNHVFLLNLYDQESNDIIALVLLVQIISLNSSYYMLIWNYVQYFLNLNESKNYKDNMLFFKGDFTLL